MKLPILKPRELARILKRLGFTLARQKGSHAYFKHRDGRATVVPIHHGEDVAPGTLRAILDDIEISLEDFIEEI